MIFSVSNGKSRFHRTCSVFGCCVIMSLMVVCVFASIEGRSSVVAGEVVPPSVERSPEELFTLEVLPLLRNKCFGCHGEGDELRGEYLMTSREALLCGGESGDVAIVPGDLSEGTLLGAIRWEDQEMPPKESERLSLNEIAMVERWVDAGAPWPTLEQQHVIREASQGAVLEPGMVRWNTSGGTSKEWTGRPYAEEDLWAFKQLPAAEDGLPENVQKHDAIDFFVNKRLSKANLMASAKASPPELLRRIFFDL
ncbi:MAG: hypothetical protein HOK57_06115, partial [Planctomycetaceae bacterium]|nr:hypothetical protein [Planctomycetaceae bacterium]